MEQTPPPPLVSDERKPLSYYMRNGLWYFTQPPDAITGQVIPQSTVEIWLSRVEEMEADRTKLLDKITRLEGSTNFEVVPKEVHDRTREVVQALVNEGNSTMAFLEPLVEGWLADGDDEAARYPSDLCERLRTLIALAKSINIEPTKP